ncbi:MAG: urease accessory protein UreH, partial [Calditrichaeota bacterium]
MDTSIWPIVSLGFFLGIKHALDADHLIAVTTIVSRSRGWKQASKIGI